MEWMCLDFINSDWRDWRGSGRRANKLEDAGWREHFLQKWGLPAQSEPSPGMLTALAELRERLRGMIESLNAGSPLEESDLSVLNEAMASASLHLRLTIEDNVLVLGHVSAAHGWVEVMGRVAVSFAELVTTEDARRIKICGNEDCRWVFFDESRSRTKRWCDDKCCGNLLKVRRFRARQKTESEAKMEGTEI